MNPRVRFDDEADLEYRFAGRWYETRREHLGTEFLDAVDMTIDRIVAMPRVGARSDGCRQICQYGVVQWRASPTMSSTSN